MAVVYGATGAGANGTTSYAPAYPGGINAATSKLFCVVTGRSNTSEIQPTMPAGWTRIGGLEGGVGTWGVDTGTRRVDVFRKDVVTGTESGSVTVSLIGNTSNTLSATVFRVEVPGGYDVAAQVSAVADTTHGLNWSVTSSSLVWKTGQTLIVATAQNTDSATQSSQAISASGVSFDTRTNVKSTAVTNGNDHRSVIDVLPVLSAATTTTATWSHTNSANASGVTLFLLLGEVPVSSGTLAATESGSDAVSGAGGVAAVGSLAAAEAGVEGFAAGGMVFDPYPAIFDAGIFDTGIFDTYVEVTDSTGSLAAHEQGGEALSGAATLQVRGTLAATEAGADTLAVGRHFRRRRSARICSPAAARRLSLLRWPRPNRKSMPSPAQRR